MGKEDRVENSEAVLMMGLDGIEEGRSHEGRTSEAKASEAKKYDAKKPTNEFEKKPDLAKTPATKGANDNPKTPATKDATTKTLATKSAQDAQGTNDDPKGTKGHIKEDAKIAPRLNARALVLSSSLYLLGLGCLLGYAYLDRGSALRLATYVLNYLVGGFALFLVLLANVYGMSALTPSNIRGNSKLLVGLRLSAGKFRLLAYLLITIEVIVLIKLGGFSLLPFLVGSSMGSICSIIYLVSAPAQRSAP